MADILYVVGNGSRYDDLELRYSLRSLAKFCTNVCRVFVAGHCPDWLSDKVVRIPVEQDQKCPQQNVIHGIEAAVWGRFVKDDFILSHDDMFWLKPTDLDAYPVYAMGDLPVRVEYTDRFYNYQTSLVQSRWILEHEGLPTKYHCGHWCVHVSAKSVLDQLESSAYLFKAFHQDECHVDSVAILGNLYLAYNKDVKTVNMNELKFLVQNPKPGDFITHVNGKPMVSTGDNDFDNGEVRAFMDYMFGEKCVYEK